VLRSLPASESVFRRKFARALQHLRAYDEHGSGTPAGILRSRCPTQRSGSGDRCSWTSAQAYASSS
jgi:hypothetical protein